MELEASWRVEGAVRDYVDGSFLAGVRGGERRDSEVRTGAMMQ